VRAVSLVEGGVSVLDRADVDTDQIMPKQFLKRIERTGFGEFVFHDWREDPDFVLNDERYAGARVLVAGPNFGEQIDTWVGADLTPLPAVWRATYFPAVVLTATLVLSLLYNLGIPGRSRWSRDVPGAVVASGVWLLGSGGLRLYGAYIADPGSEYGPLAGPIVVMLWLWLTAFAVLLGAELNGQIARTRPARRGDRSGRGRAVTDETAPLGTGEARVSGG
jgi:hypothetical protein